MPAITVLFHYPPVESLTPIGDSALSHSFSSPSHKNPLNAASMQHILTASSPQTYDAVDATPVATVIPTTTTNSNYHIKTNSVIAIKESLSGIIASYLVPSSKSALPQSPLPPPPPPYTAIEGLHWDAASSKIPNGVIGAVATLSLFVLARHCLQKLRSRRQTQLTLPSLSSSNTSSAPVSDTCPAACFLILAPAITSYTKNHFRSGAPSASRHSPSHHYVRSHRQSLSPLTTTNELLRQQYLQEFLAPVSHRPSKACVPPPPFTPLAVAPSVFTFTPEEHSLSFEATDFIHQPNPDYLSATSDEELQQVLNPQSATPTKPSPGLTDMSSPDSSCQTSASDSGANSGYAHGQIIHGSGRDGQSWSRHTVVYGNGPCPCCIGKGGGTYGPNVPPTEKQD